MTCQWAAPHNLRSQLFTCLVLLITRTECHNCRVPVFQWMRARWTSDPCYAFYGVDGSDCSFLIYLSEVEWFCPPLPWRNQTATPTLKPPPKRQVTYLSLTP